MTEGQEFVLAIFLIGFALSFAFWFGHELGYTKMQDECMRILK